MRLLPPYTEFIACLYLKRDNFSVIQRPSNKKKIISRPSYAPHFFTKAILGTEFKARELGGLSLTDMVP